MQPLVSPLVAPLVASLFEAAPAGGGGGPVSDITSLEVVGPTLLDATGDYGDATTRIGVNGNGWVCKATMPYLIGQTFDPTKIALNLSDPGFDASGTTTVTRQVRGGVILRRQYNAQASLQQSNNGVTLTVYFTVTADDAGFGTIFQGTTIVSASAASGFYGGSASGAISSLTNSSTVAYPKPLACWLQRQHVVAGSGGHYVELYVASWCGMNGQMVPRVEFIGKDSQGTPNVAATQTCTTPVLSTLLTKGQPPECYPTTIPVTALTQGDLCFVNAKVYPWIGDASAVLDLQNDGVGVTGNWATANAQTTLRFVNDKAGTYGGAHVAVKAGWAGTTQVQTSRALAETTPYATIVAALAAGAAWNNTNKGHNDTGGLTIWLMDDGAGGAVEHAIAAAMTSQTAGIGLTEIRPSPANTATASVYINAAIGLHKRVSFHCDIRVGSSGYFRGFNDATAYYCDGTFTQEGANGSREALAVAYNLTHSGTGVFDLTVSEAGVQLLGYVNKNASEVQTRAHLIVGCDFEHVRFADIASGTGSPSSQDGKIIANNKFMKLTSAVACGLSQSGMTKGFAIVQNIIERSTGTTPALSLFESTNTSSVPMGSVLIGNTIIGDRTNILYCGVAGTQGVLKQMTSRFNLLKERNTKGDVFSGLSGNTGNWKFSFDVDNFDVVMTGDTNGATPASQAWIGEFWNEPANAKVGLANVPFKADAGVDGTGAGGGDYRPTGTASANAATSKVPEGKSPMTFYQNGVAREDDGTDAAGALAWAA